MSGKIEAIALSTNESVQTVLTSSVSKSQKIRTLFSQGHSKSAIASLLDIRYQHVRNVLLQTPKSVVLLTKEFDGPQEGDDSEEHD